MDYLIWNVVHVLAYKRLHHEYATHSAVSKMPRGQPEVRKCPTLGTGNIRKCPAVAGGGGGGGGMGTAGIDWCITKSETF